MTASHRTGPPVVIVGGGLAGLAAAVGLAQAGVRATLYESRGWLGGRASSYRDPGSGQLVDNCQHVSMGCCTNLQRFAELTGIADAFRRERVLYFIGPDGRPCRFVGSRWLPAPLHLAGGLLALRYLSFRDRWAIGRALLAMGRLRPESPVLDQTMDAWLTAQRQPAWARRAFWDVVLVSALSETADQISVARARQVFVEGFMAHRQAYEVDIPRLSLGELYGTRLSDWLAERGVTIELGRRVKTVEPDAAGDGFLVSRADGQTPETIEAAAVMLAVPWRHAGDLVAPPLRNALPELEPVAALRSAPISSVHLWLDRPITDLPHAVLVDRLSQWLFSRGQAPLPEPEGGSAEATSQAHYYQVVISASHELAGRPRQAVVEEVLAELRALWPAAADAKLLHWQLISERAAVFSPTAEAEALRPAQRTGCPGLYLAGDWTQTGWPATMEGAVRSGFLAAEALLADRGQPAQLVAGDLPWGWLARLLLRPSRRFEPAPPPNQPAGTGPALAGLS